jgi:hypothetical protein
VSFFDEFSPSGEHERGDDPPTAPRSESIRDQPPLHEVLPKIVPNSMILASSGNARIALECVRCWPGGFSLDLAVFVSGEGLGPDELMFFPRSFLTRRATSEARPRIGLLFSDGRRGANIGHLRRAYQRGTDALTLAPDGGRGSRTHISQSIYIRPLPPPGPLTLITAWPERGVPETRVSLDGTGIRSHGQEAISIWQPT